MPNRTPWQQAARVNNTQFMVGQFDQMSTDEIEEYLTSGEPTDQERRAAQLALEKKNAAGAETPPGRPDAMISDNPRPLPPGLAPFAAALNGDEDEETSTAVPVIPVERAALAPPPGMTGRSKTREMLDRLMEKNTGEVSDQDKYLALAAAGAGIAASPSKYPLQAIGQGAQVGFSAFQQARQSAARNQMLTLGQKLASERDDETVRATGVRETQAERTLTEAERRNKSLEKLAGEKVTLDREQFADKLALSKDELEIKKREFTEGKIGEKEYKEALANYHNAMADWTRSGSRGAAGRGGSTGIERLADSIQEEAEKNGEPVSRVDAIKIARGDASKETIAGMKNGTSLEAIAARGRTAANRLDLAEREFQLKERQYEEGKIGADELRKARTDYYKAQSEWTTSGQRGAKGAGSDMFSRAVDKLREMKADPDADPADIEYYEQRVSKLAGEMPRDQRVGRALSAYQSAINNDPRSNAPGRKDEIKATIFKQFGLNPDGTDARGNGAPKPAGGPGEPKTPAAAPGGPAVGAVVNGYKFKGGDPNDRRNWEKAQ
jgi:hypothetical protein